MRPESRFVAAADAEVDSREVIEALRASGAISSDARHDAIARALSGADGWREALRLLGGAFVAEVREVVNDGGEGSINQPTSEYLQRPELKSGGNAND